MTLLINKSKQFENLINHKRIYKLMKKENMLSEYRQKNPYKSIPNVTSEHKTYDNLVDTNFDTPYAYNVLCTDVTYLICNGMRVYMSAIKDAATGKIVAYGVSESLKIDFVLDTIKQLNYELLISKLLCKHQITQSMSRRGKCTDNASIELFFGHFKCEVVYEDCKNMKDLKSIIDDYKIYYNYERPQMHKQKMTLHEVECHLMCTWVQFKSESSSY